MRHPVVKRDALPKRGDTMKTGVTASKRRLLVLLALIALAFALGLVACSGGDDGALPTEPTLEEPAPPAKPEPEPADPPEVAEPLQPEPEDTADDETPAEMPASPAEADDRPLVADPAEGKEIYLAAGCGGCHGFDGEGSEIGPALVGHTGEQVRRQVRAPLATMPSYDVSQISDADLEKIAAYVESLGPAETHVEPVDLPELIAMHHWLALSAIRSENIDDAVHHVKHVIKEVKGDHLRAMEGIAEQLSAGEAHDAEHAIEAMLAGTAEPDLTLKALHLELALAAIETGNGDEAIHHTEHFVELARGEEKATGELVLAQLEAGDLHSAQHAIEAVLGFTPHG